MKPENALIIDANTQHDNHKAKSESNDNKQREALCLCTYFISPQNFTRQSYEGNSTTVRAQHSDITFVAASLQHRSRRR
jgi:hypothetical protein